MSACVCDAATHSSLIHRETQREWVRKRMNFEPTLLSSSSSSMSSYKNSATALRCMQLAHSKGLDRVIKLYFRWYFFLFMSLPFCCHRSRPHPRCWALWTNRNIQKKPKGGIWNRKNFSIFIFFVKRNYCALFTVRYSIVKIDFGIPIEQPPARTPLCNGKAFEISGENEKMSKRSLDRYIIPMHLRR